ncbi:MAG: cytochrome b/b6 domain-containing protein [Phycisphaerae bacterium]|nr:cytochrome b/b6 domain-containing protein [Phycisphaerae bacterium]
MPRTLVWDLPVRVFHWSVAAGFVGAAIIGVGAGEESPAFVYHAVLGLAIALLVVLRLVWGLIGSRHARLWSFAWGPMAVLEYARSVVAGRGRRFVGHNPGSSWAIFAMLGLVLGLAATGIMLGRGNEGAKDVHEIMAYALIGVAVVHVAGVALHSVRHRENITASMVHGRKDAPASEAIRSAHPAAALVMVLITAGWTTALVRSYEPVTGVLRIPVLNAELKIGEAERAGGERPGRRDGRDDD